MSQRKPASVRPRVVILGTGFGGVHTYSRLRNILNPQEADIVLIDRNNYFLFTPMLHEVATGGLNRQHIIEPTRRIIRRSADDLLIAEVKMINLDKKTVRTSKGTIPYDYLVIATGATTNFFGVPGAQKYSCVLKNLGDAVRLRDHFIDTFEKASRINNRADRQRMLSFAVVGGGATGVELAAEMADFFYKTFAAYYKNIYCAEEVRLCLVNRGAELIGQFHPALRAKALEILKEKGVEVRLNSGVEEVTKDGLKLSEGGFLPAQTVVWTAGVTPNTPQFKSKIEIERGRIKVDDFLRVKGRKDIFALGDVAQFVQGKDARPLPMLAQVATKEARVAARNIARSIRGKAPKSFLYHSKGELLSLGQWRAIGNIFGMNLSGPHIWWLWRTVYLLKFNSWVKRVKIAIDWTVNAFAPRDIAKTE